ncbi:hypothetical protein NOVOSPHI9U_540007 [Novosphingobium sp. 9U]|nr:hypothetical protein NOVOSPHI9U_540007 [Novosphingobium sp. 9U]
MDIATRRNGNGSQAAENKCEKSDPPPVGSVSQRIGLHLSRKRGRAEFWFQAFCHTPEKIPFRSDAHPLRLPAGSLHQRRSFRP